MRSVKHIFSFGAQRSLSLFLSLFTARQVLKQVHPDTGISQASMAIMNSFSHDMISRIVKEACVLLERDRKTTLTARHIQTAVRLNLPGELSKHAVRQCVRAWLT